MDLRLQAGLELQLEKQAQQEHNSSLSGVLGQYFKQAEETAEDEFSNHPFSSKTGPEGVAEKILNHPLWKKIKFSYPGQHARPQRGVPGSHSRGTINGVALPTREQWYDNAMSHRYNKGQISEQEYQEYLKPNSPGAAQQEVSVPETLREILVGNWARTRRGAKRIRKSLAPRGERPTKSYFYPLAPSEKRK